MQLIKKLLQGAALMAGLMAMVAASAQTKWDMYAFSGANHPVTLRLKGFAEEVAKATNGQLVITVRPAGEFPFKASEVVRAVGTGQIQIGEAYSGFISGAVPLSSVANLPMLVRNSEDLTKVWPHGDYPLIEVGFPKTCLVEAHPSPSLKNSTARSSAPPMQNKVKCLSPWGHRLSL